MSELIISGTVTGMVGPKNVNDKTEVTNFYLVTDGQYSQTHEFTLFNERKNLLNGFNQGDRVDVFFNINTREHQGRYYHSLIPYKIERQGSAVNNYMNQQAQQMNQQQAPQQQQQFNNPNQGYNNNQNNQGNNGFNNGGFNM